MSAISSCKHFKFKDQNLSKLISVFEREECIEDIYNTIDRQINFVTGRERMFGKAKCAGSLTLLTARVSIASLGEFLPNDIRRRRIVSFRRNVDIPHYVGKRDPVNRLEAIESLLPQIPELFNAVLL